MAGKKSKIAQWREKDRETLEGELLAMRRELFNLRMQHAINPLPKHTQFKATKRNIARVLMVINEKQGSK